MATAMTDQAPRLRRSRSDNVVGGVCGGLGGYLGVDPLLFRIAFVALALGGGSGVLIYLIAWVAIPEETPETPVVQRDAPANTAGIVIGAALVVVGTIMLVNRYAPAAGELIWPIAIIAVGLALVIRRFQS